MVSHPVAKRRDLHVTRPAPSNHRGHRPTPDRATREPGKATNTAHTKNQTRFPAQYPHHHPCKADTLQSTAVLDRYDIRDVRLFIGRDLRALLMEEARLWRATLRWEYTQSIELLLSYLDSRILPGFVAVERATGQIRGYCFSVYEAQKAVVGDVFAIGPDADALETLLLNHLLPMLQHTPGVDRVESQLLLEAERRQAPFLEHGFDSHRRFFMEAELPDLRELLPQDGLVRRPDDPVEALPAGLKLLRWAPVHYQPTGDLIHRCYQHHGDAHINDQYRTIQGSLRFLHNIVRFPGCGVFDPEHSWVIRDERSTQLEAVILTSRVEPDVAHITQVCIAPSRRGHGIGRMLMRHVATALATKGINAITLTVTEANTQALNLYRNLGFRERVTFYAHIWKRPRS
jgi:GNAT superfamily N-acetyltransferase